MRTGNIYKCSAGETFDSIAREVYGNEKYAAELLSENVKLCGELVFKGGERLYLPDITDNVDTATGLPATKAPWKE